MRVLLGRVLLPFFETFLKFQVIPRGLVGHGVDAGLHYIRTKDGAEVDFALSEGESITQLIECKLSDETPHKALTRFAAQFSQAQAVQIVGNLRQEELVQGIQVTDAARWLAQLEV
jgi:predicted AAA+ superfamily ATPase